jgi:hypothetical protein
LTQIAPQDFRGRALVHGFEAVFGVEPVALAGCFSTGSTLALDGGGAGDRFDEERFETEAVAELLDFGLAAVDYVANAGDGDGGFGDVGG